MAKITIVIRDTPEGGIDCKAVLKPVYNPLHKQTPAQNMAGLVLSLIEDTAKQFQQTGDITDEQSNIRGTD